MKRISLSLLMVVATHFLVAHTQEGTAATATEGDPVAELKRSYQETRINGFIKLHEAHLSELERLLAERLQGGVLAEANLVNAEIERVKGRLKLLNGGAVIPVPVLEKSPPEGSSTLPSLEKAVIDHRAALQTGVDQLNRQHIAKIDQLQRSIMGKGDLAGANALEVVKERWKAEISASDPATATAPGLVQPAADLSEGISLLAPERRKTWAEDRGVWEFEMSALTGSGNSEISYRDTIRPPFTLAFGMNVEKGLRPRIYVGRYVIANEGYARELCLKPINKGIKPIPYENGDEIEVRLVVNRRFIELHLDGKLIERREPGVEGSIDEIRFSGGDSWSPGVTKFSNIRLIK